MVRHHVGREWLRHANVEWLARGDHAVGIGDDIVDVGARHVGVDNGSSDARGAGAALEVRHDGGGGYERPGALGAEGILGLVLCRGEVLCERVRRVEEPVAGLTPVVVCVIVLVDGESRVEVVATAFHLKVTLCVRIRVVVVAVAIIAAIVGLVLACVAFSATRVIVVPDFVSAGDAVVPGHVGWRWKTESDR